MTNVSPPIGWTDVWIWQPPAPTDSMTKPPSSSGPDNESVRNAAVSSAFCIQPAIWAVSSLATEYVALTGSGLIGSAIADPGNLGNPVGTLSQMRPQPVSVWAPPMTLALGAAPLAPSDVD